MKKPRHGIPDSPPKNKTYRILVSRPLGHSDDIFLEHDASVGVLRRGQVRGKDVEIIEPPKNGFSLLDMHEKIVKPSDKFQPVPDAYVFAPIGKGELKENNKKTFLQEIFKAASLFVGLQTADPALARNPNDPTSPAKPLIFMNYQGCWQPFYDLALSMHEQGTVSIHPDNYMQMVEYSTGNPQTAMKYAVNEVIDLLDEHSKSRRSARALTHAKHSYNFTKEELLSGQADPEQKDRPDYNVCVFCSASTKDNKLIKMSETLGSKIAERGWGCISGLGATGMMGGVVRGAAAKIAEQKAEGVERRGWVGGSNLLRILDFEGPPVYYDKLWLEDDIYKRMNTMINNSESFLIMPGGMGTVQEFLTLLQLRHSGEKDPGHKFSQMHKKPIIVVSPPYGAKNRPFWEKLEHMAEAYGFKKGEHLGEGDFMVVSSVQDAMKALNQDKAKYDEWKVRMSRKKETQREM